MVHSHLNSIINAFLDAHINQAGRLFHWNQTPGALPMYPTRHGTETFQAEQNDGWQRKNMWGRNDGRSEGLFSGRIQQTGNQKTD